MKTPSSYHNPKEESRRQKLDRLAEERAEYEQEENRLCGEIERKRERLEEEIEDKIYHEEGQLLGEVLYRLDEIGGEIEDEIVKELDRLAVEAYVEGVEGSQQELKLWLSDNQQTLIWLLLNFTHDRR